MNEIARAVLLFFAGLSAGFSLYELVPIMGRGIRKDANHNDQG